MPKKPMTRSEMMSRVKSKNTSNEMLLRRELWRRGLRYRANDKTVFGKPDVVFKGKKIAVFIDSEFWHGKDFLEGKNIPKDNNAFWVEKLQRNTARDKTVDEYLTSNGWNVIRIWAKELKKDVSKFADLIEQQIKELHDYSESDRNN
jgi:DNA mismatch endonuclease (patch repair protein)